MSVRWIFVYDADSGGWASAKASAFKLLGLAQHTCPLCHLSHGLWTARPEWKALIARLGDQAEVLHRDEFLSRYPDRELLSPAVWRVVQSKWDLQIGPQSWGEVTTVAELARSSHDIRNGVRAV